MHDFPAINLFGICAVLIGAVGICVTAKACREASAIPLYTGRRYVAGAMLFMMGINLLIMGIGCCITLLDMQIGGGARG